jgi:hypothetical protein
MPAQQPAAYDEPFTVSKGRRIHIIGGGPSRPSQLLDESDTF